MSAPLVPILLVDDRRENLIALAALLETRSDLDIVLANSGEEALRQLLIRDFGLVLLDVQMPDMDGFEAATLIRANPKTRQVPIIFVTALMNGSDFEFRGYESGAVDYLVKPLEAFILHAKVEVFVNLYRQRLALAEHERYMAHVEQMVGERTGHRPSHDNKLRVLLVDDRPENLIALEAMLMEMDDVLLVKANSGSEALRAVLRDDFAVILMDVQMPGMDGFETAGLIRSNPKTHLIPVIFVTAGMKTINSITQGYRQGAVDYLIKPLEPAIVKSKVKVFCDLYKHRLSLEKHSTYLEILVADRTSALQNSATELTENNERYRRLVEKLELATRAAGLGIWDWNVVSNELVWDARMIELYGYSADSFGGSYQDWISRLHPDDRVHCDVAVQNALYQHQPYDTDFRISLPDGRIRDIKADGKVVFDELGQPLRMTGINYDVTERKRAAEEVRLHRDHLLELVDERTASLKAIVDHAADGIITIDQFGTVLSFNTAAERMFVYPANAVIGNNISMLMPTSVAKEHNSYIQHYLKTGEAHIIGSGRELHGRRSDGSIFPLYLAVSETKVGEQLRFTGIARDISSQKAMEANLIQAREVAEAANLAKSVFLSNMSHELRTPLNAVIGFSRLMSREESLNEHQRQNLEIINHAGNHLLTLINDVLELSKIEAGRTQLLEESTDLPRLLQEVGAMLRGRAEQAQLGLHLDMSNLPSTVRVDAIKLRQVLINLLGNAIKFTQQGEVRLQVAAQSSERGRVNLAFVVSDSGIGIAPEKLEQIFDPFVQLVTHATTAGTGLGLSLSREYVRLLGGEINVDSSPGKGSAFRFCLNLALAEMPAANQALSATVTGLPATQQGKRILIVDDDPDSCLLLHQLLQPLGFIVDQAHDGLAAIAQNAQFAPDLIILDRLLPKLDGMAVIRQVRGQQQENQPQIVVLTSSAMDEQRKEVLEAGANEFLSKPMEESKLFSILERLLHIEFSRSAPVLPALKPAQTDLQPADLHILRPELRLALRNGAGEMNQLKLKQDLALLASEHAALAARILVMVENFRYRELWNLFEEST